MALPQGNDCPGRKRELRLTLNSRLQTVQPGGEGHHAQCLVVEDGCGPAAKQRGGEGAWGWRVAVTCQLWTLGSRMEPVVISLPLQHMPPNPSLAAAHSVTQGLSITEAGSEPALRVGNSFQHPHPFLLSTSQPLTCQAQNPGEISKSLFKKPLLW